ncbi:MAG: RNA-binding transcriptional accessory protein [Bdellovibrionales bacterium CG12_big_fil_rev_8_21_14_0_65_38_15]|nr:MAG: RNA-binding transcriptional accessory protein [Bdellovibrionales bacterium CG22_combo_CG10-13_8_21_14_all_38_13]PIQ57030.1 MAG: RNA-binding transcriptional accessory protein [Bdellovibrionales bacterium CG12_big_fil_rev_8_21_14_0_65_38_15]PIR29008.1 MAG: RNA-binding transcriptional accessory protein [Bdellovibrionales bacterium CG11_big_fil_rev_8_21_14_0_20_38_13]
MTTTTMDTGAIAYAVSKTKITANSVLSVLKLIIDEQCTIPFITRYRKEMTGGLDETQVQAIQEAYEECIEIEKRRAYVLDTIVKMEKMTPQLEKLIKAATTLNQIEDIYAPYKSKKKTKGQMAEEAGLLPLAEMIMNGKLDLAKLETENETKFINKEHKITSWKEALDGAQSIIMEKIAHNPEVKEKLRQDYWRNATIVSSLRKDGEKVADYTKYKDWFEYEQKISALTDSKHGHRFLALRRGMTQKVLKVDVVFPEEMAIPAISAEMFDLSKIGCRDFVENCIKKAHNLAIHPSLDLEVKGELKKVSDESAINVFGINLKNLLLQPYLGPKAVIGLDPGIRTGVKVAVVDDTGKFVVDTVVYPHPPKQDVQKSAMVIDAIIEQFKVTHIAIGNGTYGRETLDFVEKNVKAVKDGKAMATLISEAGASIYSASEIARKEFPDKDPTVRGAISIARRFQDPLAELVKIDPKSIGVGQYQHDVNQIRLKKQLTGVVESCVNYVGVDLNTASAPLLSFVSGIGPSVAENVVKHREKIGGFKNRAELLKVSRFSAKVYEQSAGFLRIYNGENPLDATFIHPESYPILENWAKKNGADLKLLKEDKDLIKKLESDKTLLGELGEFTFKDILKSLSAPSQDPRTEFKSFEFRKDISKIGDLKENDWYPGVVTNITQFGAFVDIGLKENGLVHISQMADKFVDNPLEVLKVGQEVNARVMAVDLERGRVSLSLKKDDGQGVATSYAERGIGQGQSKVKTPPPAAMKNNAFAGLKNLKI